jgi:hypothetical protein
MERVENAMRGKSLLRYPIGHEQKLIWLQTLKSSKLLITRAQIAWTTLAC